jgi:hypothetical protein
MGHLAYAGCGSLDLGEASFSQLFTNRYPGLFSLGFSDEQHPWIRHVMDKDVFMPCPRDPGKLQVAAVDRDDLERKLTGIPIEHATKIRSLMHANLLSPSEIVAEISAIDPTVAHFAEDWQASKLKNCTLTSVGIAIAHANCRRILGSEFPPVDIWLD